MTLASLSTVRCQCPPTSLHSAGRRTTSFDNFARLLGRCYKVCPTVSCRESSQCRMLQHATSPEHITPVLRQLLWLPVRQRVTFELAFLEHQEQPRTGVPG